MRSIPVFLLRLLSEKRAANRLTIPKAYVQLEGHSWEGVCHSLAPNRQLQKQQSAFAEDPVSGGCYPQVRLKFPKTPFCGTTIRSDRRGCIACDSGTEDQSMEFVLTSALRNSRTSRHNLTAGSLCIRTVMSAPLRSLSERIWYGKACRLLLLGRSRDASIQVK